MINNLLYLYQVPGLGNNSIKKLLIENSLLVDDLDYIKYLIKVRYNQRFEPIKDRVEMIKENSSRLNITIVNNPNRLIPDYPLLLFLKGNINLLDSKRTIALAGTRTPTKKGVVFAKKFSEVLFHNGGVLVSGMAIGCDRAAQYRILEIGGATISVLPRGFVRDDEELLKLGDHLLISEYTPLSHVRKYRCVRRNRIIAGLTKALYLPEIKEKGGSYYTIGYASEMKIPVACSISPKSCRLDRISSIRDMEVFIKGSFI